MQSTILFLQQELKTSKDTICGLELEIKQLKNGARNSDRHEDKDEDDCIDIVNDQDDENHRDQLEMAKKQKKNHNATSFGNGIPVESAVCADVGNGNEALVNNTATITNCSVVLRAPAGVDREVLKLNNSERILRKDKQSVGGKIINPPRTLRSSRRNDVARTIVSAKVHNKNSADAEDTDVIDGDDDNENAEDEVDIGVERNGDHRSSDDLLESKSNNNKRSFDESESTECSSDDESGSTEVVLQPPATPVEPISGSGTHKHLIKKARRSSVLSLDLNEEDSQINCHEEDRTIIVNSSNGTKVGRTTD